MPTKSLCAGAVLGLCQAEGGGLKEATGFGVCLEESLDFLADLRRIGARLIEVGRASASALISKARSKIALTLTASVGMVNHPRPIRALP